MPPRIVDEARRAPVAIPKSGSLDNRQTSALLYDLRKSELRYKRAAMDAVTHDAATRQKKGK